MTMRGRDDENAQAEAQKVISTAQSIEYKQALMRLVATPDGKIVIKKLLEDCQIWKDTFEKSASSVYSDGKKSIGYPIFNLIREEDAVMLLPLMSNKFNLVSGKAN